MKKNGRRWPPDVVVEEVRAARAALWRESGESIEKYIELVNQLSAEAMKRRKVKGKRTRRISVSRKK